MFYEVRIFDAKNKLKKIIPIKELSRRHWDDFEKSKTDLPLLNNENENKKAGYH